MDRSDARRSNSPVARLFAALLAVVGPVAVLGAVGWWALRIRDSEDLQAEQNAGLVFNGQVRAAGAVAAMDAVMAREPDVVVIGPSYANTDLRRDRIAKHLGLPPGEVAVLSIPNSVGAHWYAVLKYRVYGNGHRPRLVVVLSGLQSMLLTTPLSESSWVNLHVQLDDPADPVVAAKARESTSLMWARMREQRGKARDRVMRVLREVPTRWLLPSTVRDGGMGPLEVRARLDRVFADENVSMALHTARSTPVVAGTEERPYDPSMLPEPEASFIEDIAALAEAHGTRTVWVRPPMSPKIPAHLDDVVPDGFQERAAALVERHGGTFLDMRRLVMTQEMFKNEDHMNAEGSLRFSEALGKALAALDALELEPAPDTPPFDAAEIRNTTDLSRLPPAEAAWEGEGIWVGPGSELVLSFDRPWTRPRGAFAVKVAAEQLGPDGAPPRVEVDGRRVRLWAADAAPGWRLWRADRRLDPPGGPFEVRVAVPVNGAWLRVTGLALGRGAARTIYVGDAVGVDGAVARLFGRDGAGVPDFPLEPGPVPMKFVVHDLPGRTLAKFDTPKWDFLSDERLAETSGLGNRCSPLRVTEDGAPLPHPNTPCAEVVRHGHGRTCHALSEVWFSASDGSDPARNGRRYRMVLDPGRRCGDAVWLYPKDRFVARWPADALAALRRGATHFTLRARYLQKRKAEFRVVLRVDGRVRLDATVDGRDLYDAPRVWRLDPPIPPGTRDVEVEVENLEYTFYLFDELALSEGPLPSGDGRWLAR